jgi:hypothetical protein
LTAKGRVQFRWYTLMPARVCCSKGPDSKWLHCDHCCAPKIRGLPSPPQILRQETLHLGIIFHTHCLGSMSIQGACTTCCKGWSSLLISSNSHNCFCSICIWLYMVSRHSRHNPYTVLYYIQQVIVDRCLWGTIISGIIDNEQSMLRLSWMKGQSNTLHTESMIFWPMTSWW